MGNKVFGQKQCICYFTLNFIYLFIYDKVSLQSRTYHNTSLTMFFFKKYKAGCWWLTPIILATQGRQRPGGSWFEASPANSSRDPISKNPSQK
jgi:hypothetical protein